MLQLRVFTGDGAVCELVASLRDTVGVTHVMQTEAHGHETSLVTADLLDEAVDTALALVARVDVPDEDVVLIRLDAVGPAAAQQRLGSVIWADLLSQAGLNARPLSRYLVFMACAGVIAAFGVIYANVTLIVGAMAISPDTLPITAVATALVVGRWRLSARAFLALTFGLGLAGLVGGVLTFVLHQLGLLPTVLEIGQRQFLEGLASVNISTPLVAFAAGVAGMLALETRASSAVGVAISVTTIPASALLGVAAGLGELSHAESALLVLGINVTVLLVGGSLTLLVQRHLGRDAIGTEGRAPEPELGQRRL